MGGSSKKRNNKRSKGVVTHTHNNYKQLVMWVCDDSKKWEAVIKNETMKGRMEGSNKNTITIIKGGAT